MTLTNENTASSSKDPPEAGKELKLSVNQQETQITVKNLLQVMQLKTFLITVYLDKNQVDFRKTDKETSQPEINYELTTLSKENPLNTRYRYFKINCVKN